MRWQIWYLCIWQISASRLSASCPENFLWNFIQRITLAWRDRISGSSSLVVDCLGFLFQHVGLRDLPWKRNSFVPVERIILIMSFMFPDDRHTPSHHAMDDSHSWPPSLLMFTFCRTEIQWELNTLSCHPQALPSISPFFVPGISNFDKSVFRTSFPPILMAAKSWLTHK